MKRELTILMLALLAFGLASVRIEAHPRSSDPLLAELNDYLMALQILKESDEEAARLFSLWQEVRTASWKIRELTDQGGLASDSQEVLEQKKRTHRLRERLHRESLEYFERMSQRTPTVSIRLAGDIEVAWSGPTLEAQVGESLIVPIRIQNETGQEALLELSTDKKNEMLYWDKKLIVGPETSRFDFMVLSPTAGGELSNRLIVRQPPRSQRSVAVRAVVSELKREVDREVPDRAIRIRVRDAETGQPLAARAEVKDEGGQLYWEPLSGSAYAVSETRYGHWETPLWKYQPGPHFYLDGEATLGVDPAGKSIRIFHGFEYLPIEMQVPDDGGVEVALKPWIDMEELGWYSGQTHIHTTDQGMPVPFFRSWPMVAAAEDLRVSHILTLKGEWTSHAIYANELPMGPVPVSTPQGHLISYGEEYRNNPYGHLCFLGVHELIQPISSGALGELGGPDYPPNAFVLDQALAQGASTIGAHFGLSITEGEAIVTPWPSTGFEMPIDVALGKIHLAEIYGNGGQLEIWYKLLNCGFELAATAGPDWVIEDTPRAYVYLGDRELTLENWLNGLEKGDSFITRGPMLFFSVEGGRPGTRLHLPEKEAGLRVKAEAIVPGGSVPVEIVVNGEVVARGSEIDTVIRLDDSAWIAARTENAHSNPVYVELAGRPRGSVEDPQVFIRVADRLKHWVMTRGIFDHDDQRDAVLEVIAEGRAVYEKIIERARRLDRD